MNRSLAETGGAALVVSQFTLYGDTRKGRRPSWGGRGPPGAGRAAGRRICRRAARARNSRRNRAIPGRYGRRAGQRRPRHSARRGTEPVACRALDRIESSHSIWLFDTERKRFRRLPRGADIDAPALDADWEQYFALELDEAHRCLHRDAQRGRDPAAAGLPGRHRDRRPTPPARRDDITTTELRIPPPRRVTPPSQGEHLYDSPVTQSAETEFGRVGDDLVAGLNPVQREAVIAPDGPVLVIAGAGSGKTRLLTHRVAYLIAERDVSPFEILAITFTNKAAGEMKERVAELVGPVAHRMWVSTFHSACARILRREAGPARLPLVVLDLRPGRRDPPRGLRAPRHEPGPEAVPAPPAAGLDLRDEERAHRPGAGARRRDDPAREAAGRDLRRVPEAARPRRPRRTSTTCSCSSSSCSGSTRTRWTAGASGSATCSSTSSRTPTWPSGSSSGCSPRSTATSWSWATPTSASCPAPRSRWRTAPRGRSRRSSRATRSCRATATATSAPRASGACTAPSADGRDTDHPRQRPRAHLHPRAHPLRRPPRRFRCELRVARATRRRTPKRGGSDERRRERSRRWRRRGGWS